MKKLISLALTLMLVCSCFGCAEGVTLTDAAGRSITLDELPERIVSGYYISTSLLIALGLRDKIVGIEAKADTRPIYALSAPELLSLPNVGTAKNFSLEGCLALAPDLVILPGKLAATAEELSAFGIPAIVVNPESMEELMDTVKLLGAATGTRERADKLLSCYEAMSEKAASCTSEPVSVYLAGNSGILRTAGENMYQNTLLTMAGGVNVAAELSGASWQDISYEQLLAWNPDVIVIASDAVYSADDIYGDATLAGLSAVMNKRVYTIPGDVEAWDSPVPGAVLGSLYLASVLHPENYSESDFISDVNEFYETFYGVRPYEN